MQKCPRGEGKSVGIIAGFSVTSFKIHQNKNQNHSANKVHNLGNERGTYTKTLAKIQGRGILSYTGYPKKCFTQTCRDFYGDAMLVLT